MAELVGQPPHRWTIGAGYGWMEEKPSIDVGDSSLITVPGGASYLSSTSGSLRLRARQESLSVTVALPRGDYLGWSFEIGTISSYRVWIPSGSADNMLSRSQGALVGAAVDADVVRRTMVTPRVNARFSWRWAESRPERIFFAHQNRWQSASNRWQASVLALSILVESQLRQGALLPNAGFEIFRKTVSLKDGVSNETVGGSQNGYRIFSGMSWQFSASEALKAQVSLGDEMGYKIALEQRF